MSKQPDKDKEEERKRQQAALKKSEDEERERRKKEEEKQKQLQQQNAHSAQPSTRNNPTLTPPNQSTSTQPGSTSQSNPTANRGQQDQQQATTTGSTQKPGILKRMWNGIKSGASAVWQAIKDNPKNTVLAVVLVTLTAVTLGAAGPFCACVALGATAYHYKNKYDHRLLQEQLTQEQQQGYNTMPQQRQQQQYSQPAYPQAQPAQSSEIAALRAQVAQLQDTVNKQAAAIKQYQKIPFVNTPQGQQFLTAAEQSPNVQEHIKKIQTFQSNTPTTNSTSTGPAPSPSSKAPQTKAPQTKK